MGGAGIAAVESSLVGQRCTPELPSEGMGFDSVPVLDERQDRTVHGIDGVETAVLEHSPLEDGESDLDLVCPRGVLRGVHELESATVSVVELRPALVCAVEVHVEVVPHDDDPPRVSRGHHLHVLDEVVTGRRGRQSPKTCPVAMSKLASRTLEPCREYSNSIRHGRPGSAGCNSGQRR